LVEETRWPSTGLFAASIPVARFAAAVPALLQEATPKAAATQGDLFVISRRRSSAAPASHRRGAAVIVVLPSVTPVDLVETLRPSIAITIAVSLWESRPPS
jgi:hypothetical protein